MDLIFDSYADNKDVREATNKITDLLKIDPAIHAPPILNSSGQSQLHLRSQQGEQEIHNVPLGWDPGQGDTECDLQRVQD